MASSSSSSNRRPGGWSQVPGLAHWLWPTPPTDPRPTTEPGAPARWPGLREDIQARAEKRPTEG